MKIPDMQHRMSPQMCLVMVSPSGRAESPTGGCVRDEKVMGSSMWTWESR